MSEEHVTAETPELAALHRRLAENSLGGHWQSRQRPAKLAAYSWSWSTIYSCLMESGEVVKLGHIDDAAKRRTVQHVNPRSEEHTSELQSPCNLVCRLLLEK